ncbi:glutathione S-transferase N-terminal domain-containing protein [Marinomonas aquiplantarum]|uniref:Glutathione S-transferase n=1 Tax=Marinomonas aquiplantarum TaxID=491951 RepID=A0A366D1G4_9GAMM|nr:glutathione S-transferase N-terminal domain-containing protein [Marinomonas aquiplantarum]RBO83339.1 glutathione S-transferase [Marinomonas aquiplantarum]
MKLVVGTLSTWSLRAWLCSQLAGANVKLQGIDLQSESDKAELRKLSPTGLVPALLIGDIVVHDSLAIAEYFNDFSDGALYPLSALEKAVARSLCAELHAGFVTLRQECPFSLQPVTPLTEISSDLRHELNRVDEIFCQAKGPFMFDSPGAVDAFYGILAYRIADYDLPLSDKAKHYQQALLAWPLLQQAIALRY